MDIQSLFSIMTSQMINNKPPDVSTPCYSPLGLTIITGTLDSVVYFLAPLVMFVSSLIIPLYSVTLEQQQLRIRKYGEVHDLFYALE